MKIAPIADGESGGSIRAKLNRTIEIANIAHQHVDRRGMAALDKDIGIAYLHEGKRDGLFVWENSNLSNEVAADPLQGIYLAPLTDVTGKSGAWVRMLSGYVTPEMFGASGEVTSDSDLDVASDDAPAVRAAQAFCDASKLVKTVYFPSCYVLKTFNPNSHGATTNFVQINTNCNWLGNQNRGSIEANEYTLRIYAPTNTTTFECMIRVNGKGTRWEGIAVYNGSIGSPEDLPSAVVRAGPNFYPHLMTFRDCAFNAMGPYPYAFAKTAFRGWVWGITCDSCLFFGGTFASFYLEASTSANLINCYADGIWAKNEKTYSRYGFFVASYYGTMVDCSCDNVSGGTAYHFADRQWSVMGIAAENYGLFLSSSAVSLCVNGAFPFSTSSASERWKPNCDYKVGANVRPTGGGLYFYICTVPGQSSSSEPPWPFDDGGTVRDGTVVWTRAMQGEPFRITGGNTIITEVNKNAPLFDNYLAKITAGAKLTLISQAFGYQHCRMVDRSGNDVSFGPEYFSGIMSVGTSANSFQVIKYPFHNFGHYGYSGELRYPAACALGMGASQRWTANHPYALNELVFPNSYFLAKKPAVRLAFKATAVKGRSASREPNWPSGLGERVTDGAITWTSVSYASDALGPIANLNGSGSLTVRGNYGVARSPLRFTQPMKMISCEATLLFEHIDFYFDLEDKAAHGILLAGISVVFFDCTFTVLSALRTIFGPLLAAGGRSRSIASVVIGPDCRLIGNGHIVGERRHGQTYWWRPNNTLPSNSMSHNDGAPIELSTYKSDTPTVPRDTLWDPDIDPHFEIPDSNRYLAMKCIRSGWSTEEWKASQDYELGDTVVPTVDNSYFYVCAVSGTSNYYEPDWSTGINGLVQDGPIRWNRQSGAALFKGYNRVAT